MGEVIRLMDGPLAPSPCASQSAHVPCPVYRCPSEQSCLLRALWLDVRDAISEVLDGTTFADLAQRLGFIDEVPDANVARRGGWIGS